MSLSLIKLHNTSVHSTVVGFEYYVKIILEYKCSTLSINMDNV